MDRPTRAGASGAVARLAFVSASLLGLVACSGGSGSPATTTTGAARPGSSTSVAEAPAPGTSAAATTTVGASLSAQEATAMLTTADFAVPATLDQVEDRKTDAAVITAAEELVASGADGAPKWAAVYVLANASGTATALTPFLTDPDPTIRVLAAIGSVGQGERAGFPVLIEALGLEDIMAGFEPRTSAWAVASTALARHTGLVLGPALDADDADRIASQQRWTSWWTAQGGSLTFDASVEEWRAP